MVDKHVFVIFFSGTQTSDKITKICESYNASLYDFPETPEGRSNSRFVYFFIFFIFWFDNYRTQIVEKLETLVAVQEKMEARKHVVLNDLQENVSSWASFLVREKAIFHTLNLFSSGFFFFIIVVWMMFIF
jgi:V-type H+-transporting ATPase subunit a